MHYFGRLLSHAHSISFRTSRSDGASSTSFGMVVGVRDFAYYSLDHLHAYCQGSTGSGS